MSSELPAPSPSHDLRDGSDVEVRVDDELVGTLHAPVDDGAGAVREVALIDERALRRLFARGTVHVLRFRALASRFAGGLCLYGRERANPEGGAAPEASEIVVTLER
jgi:hypothetical protein